MLLIVGLNIAFIALGAAILAALPENYFLDTAAPRSRLSKGLRNVVGGVIITVGLLMLIMPGPGLVTIVAGLVLVESRHKTQLLEQLLTRPGVYQTIARLRQRCGQPMFILRAAAQQQLQANRDKARHRR